MIPQDDIYLYNSGKAQKAYLTFGCHYVDDLKAYRFAVYAPNATSVSVVGNFNNWSMTNNPMERIEGGIFVCVVHEVDEDDIYKYAITTHSGEVLFKADPYAFASELRPNTASKICNLDGYKWKDAKYLEKKKKSKHRNNQPISIYELHLGSWKRDEDNEFLNYREIADQLSVYVKEMGFTHVEIMPITEYPLDDSWGYQVVGYYSITARYGTPQDFMYFMDKMHSAGIGVILDWVPAHFPKDAHGLRLFDGTAVYENPDPNRAEQYQWGTLHFDYGRNEVRSFLISNIMFFIEYYHIDGFRLDAISAMIYFNFGKEDINANPSREPDVINYNAVNFLRELNEVVAINHPEVMMIAEESTSYEKLTERSEQGLGFSFKWNMGFMHDMLKYLKYDPLHRKDIHHNLTFGMHYAYSENFVLSFSHDEVVHGKKSMIDKIAGDYPQKFMTLRAFYGFMYSHPGKKLLFMGDEFGQFIEWNYHIELDWFLHDYDSHNNLSKYVKDLNKFYKENPALYELDDSWEGFTWLNVDDYEHSTISYMRNSLPTSSKSPETSKTHIISVSNFTPVSREDYRLALPCGGTLVEVLNSDNTKYGGGGMVNKKKIKSTVITEKTGTANGASEQAKDHYALINLPALSTIYFEFTMEEKKSAKTSKTSKVTEEKLKKEVNAKAESVNKKSTTKDEVEAKVKKAETKAKKTTTKKAVAEEKAETKAKKTTTKKAVAEEKAETKAKKTTTKKAVAEEKAETKAKKTTTKKAVAEEKAETKAKKTTTKKAVAQEKAEAKAKKTTTKKAVAQEKAETKAKKTTTKKSAAKKESKSKDK